jgi:hypothetical protein
MNLISCSRLSIAPVAAARPEHSPSPRLLAAMLAGVA